MARGFHVILARSGVCKLEEAFFQALQSYSWGFALIQSLSKLENAHLTIVITIQ